MTKSILTINKYGDLIWRNKKGEVHRDNDKSAIIHTDGTKEWRINDRLHRENDKPAIIYLSGYKEWHIDGELIKDNDD